MALADRLFGSSAPVLLRAWFGEQIERITDPGFARRFSDHIVLPGVVPGDYNHRIVRSARGGLLGGIRFYGQDVTRPFVDIIAHDFEDWTALRACVASEWAAFAPLHLRLLLAVGTTYPPGAHVDLTIHAARYCDMAPPDDRVTLRTFADAEEAVTMVAARYEDLARTDPALARNVSPAAPDDLRRWHGEGRVRAIRAVTDDSAQIVGLFTAAPGSVEWIEGDQVNEEVVMGPFAGRGFAASAQRAWAARRDVDSYRFLVGTIDGLNVASRRSATRAGRGAVLDYVFLNFGAGCGEGMD